MSFWLRSVSACLLAAAGSLACSAGVDPDTGFDEADGVESVATVEEALSCVDQCMLGCVCTPEDGKPTICRKLCLMECRALCNPVCLPSCTGKACGASDGCGGICTSGSCPGGAVCGGAGVPGQCALPNLNGTMTATLLASPFLVKKARFDILVRNMGPAAASNIELLFQTNMPAFMDQLVTSKGFVCHSLAGYEPRLGLRCFGGNIPAYDTASIQLTLALPNAGFNVLSMLADSNFAIAELDENDNFTNAGVFVP